MIRRTAIAMVLSLAAVVAGCGSSGEKLKAPPPVAPGQIRLTSPAFKDNGLIPAKYTCDGDKVSPPLQWSGVPKGVNSLALMVVDLDAGNFLHWSVWDINPSFKAIPEGKAPPNSKEGENSFGDKGYGAPCPPKGEKPHRYAFLLYALSEKLALGNGAKPNDVSLTIRGSAAFEGLLTGLYGR
jgi:Raf kinase inhibitor-like YbhB/YbcL family protein